MCQWDHFAYKHVLKTVLVCCISFVCIVVHYSGILVKEFGCTWLRMSDANNSGCFFRELFFYLSVIVVRLASVCFPSPQVVFFKVCFCVLLPSSCVFRSAVMISLLFFFSAFALLLSAVLFSFSVIRFVVCLFSTV